jgi:hypothetical protein
MLVASGPDLLRANSTWKGRTMASGNDMKEATQTYDSFISATKWGSAVVAVITLVVVLLIA